MTNNTLAKLKEIAAIAERNFMFYTEQNTTRLCERDAQTFNRIMRLQRQRIFNHEGDSPANLLPDDG